MQIKGKIYYEVEIGIIPQRIYRFENEDTERSKLPI